MNSFWDEEADGDEDEAYFFLYWNSSTIKFDPGFPLKYGEMNILEFT